MADGGAEALRDAARDVSPDDRPFAILRYAKLKSPGAIRGTSAHMRRTASTPNADPARTPGNVVLVGGDDPAAETLALVPETGARGDDGRLLRRANSVLAVEVLMTTSPEWWRDASPADRAAWAETSAAWLAAEWGAENVAHLELHDDETTGHLTGLIVPRDPDTGALNARRWIGGRASKREPGLGRLSGHQTRYAAAVEPFGLRRGRMGSSARHETVAAYYRRASAEPPAPPEIGRPPLTGRDAWAADLRARVAEAMAVQATSAAERPVERRRASAEALRADRAQEALQSAREARRALSDAMRALPLEPVLEALGAAYDAQDRRWKIGEPGARTSRIEVTDDRWRCAAAQSGGRGAIDLAKTVLGTDFNGALAWLSAEFGGEAVASDLTARTRARAEATVRRAEAARAPFALPEPRPDAWPAVRRHLVEERGIEPGVVDAAHAAGDLGAQVVEAPSGDQLVNVLAVARTPEGAPSGAELRGLHRRRDGSRWGGMVAGSRKPAGAFRVGVEVAVARAVVVVESAIDALAALTFLRRRGRAEGVAVVSTAGDGGLAAGIAAQIPEGATRVAAQDADRAGDRAARALGTGWTRLRPPGGAKDWAEWTAANRPRDDEGDASRPAPSDPFADDPDPGPSEP